MWICKQRGFVILRKEIEAEYEGYEPIELEWKEMTLTI